MSEMNTTRRSASTRRGAAPMAETEDHGQVAPAFPSGELPTFTPQPRRRLHQLLQERDEQGNVPFDLGK